MLTLANAYARVKHGWAEGELLPSGVKVFRGIPFATPPIGHLRWRPPIPPAEWLGIRKAVHFGFEAVQGSFEGYTDIPPDRVEGFCTSTVPCSEDCLYLNVWTPAETPEDGLPVFVWIHGGAFQGGAGSSFLYDSAVLAEKNIVVVTINYRMGVFGFLAHPELTEESEQHSSGNYAFLDQMMAIRWVKDNIAGFGGDPGRITIGGQSAGAISVGVILASPLAQGLFQRATIQSCPPFFFRGMYKKPKEAEEAGMQFMERADAHTVSELRQMPTWDVYQKSHEHQFEPQVIVDGWVLQDDPGATIQAGKHNHAALLLGSASDEFSDSHSPEIGLPPEEYEQNMRSMCGEKADKMLGFYPPGNPVVTARSAIKSVADSMFTGTRYTAKLARQYGDDAYLYYFTRVLPIVHGEFYGANHSIELPFLFHLVDKGEIFPWDDRKWAEFDYKYSDMVMSYWSNFVKTGDPNGGNLPEWPKYNAEDDRMLEFGDTVCANTVPVPDKLALHESML